MKNFLRITIAVQIISVMCIFPFWDASTESNLMWLIFIVWAIANIPGIILTLPLSYMFLGGIMQADALDGFGGYAMVLWPPTLVSAGLCAWLISRVKDPDVTDGGDD